MIVHPISGAQALGDPIERDPESVRADLDERLDARADRRRQSTASSRRWTPTSEELDGRRRRDREATRDEIRESASSAASRSASGGARSARRSSRARTWRDAVLAMWRTLDGGSRPTTPRARGPSGSCPTTSSSSGAERPARAGDSMSHYDPSEIETTDRRRAALDARPGDHEGREGRRPLRQVGRDPAEPRRRGSEQILLPLTTGALHRAEGQGAHRQVPLRSRVRRLPRQLEARSADPRARDAKSSCARSTAAASSRTRPGSRSASTPARAAARSSRSRRCRAAVRRTSSSCPTSTPSTATGSAGRFPTQGRIRGPDARRRPQLVATERAMSRALDGIVVLDLSTQSSGRRSAWRCSAISARTCSASRPTPRRGAMASDRDAERPRTRLGLGARTRGPQQEAASPSTSAVAEGREILEALVRRADVIAVDRPRAKWRERGWDYETLCVAASPT